MKILMETNVKLTENSVQRLSGRHDCLSVSYNLMLYNIQLIFQWSVFTKEVKILNLHFSAVSYKCILTSDSFWKKNGDFCVQISWHRVSHLRPWQLWHLVPIDELWTPLQTADILVGNLETMNVSKLVLRVVGCLTSALQTPCAEESNKNWVSLQKKFLFF